MDELIHLLNKKNDIINPTPQDTTKGALIKIAEIIQRDTTPSLPPILVQHTPTSEGEVLPKQTTIQTTNVKPSKMIATSEGEGFIDKNKDMPPMDIDDDLSME